VFAILGVNLFGEMFGATFGNLGASLFSLLQIMTLDGWVGIARPIMVVHPLAWVFFVVFMFLAFAATISFVTAVIGEIVKSDKRQVTGDKRRAVASRNDAPSGKKRKK